MPMSYDPGRKLAFFNTPEGSSAAKGTHRQAADGAVEAPSTT
jgi:hypothetical protein